MFEVFEDGAVKRIFVEEIICNGCNMCEMMCSFVNTNAFYPQKANVKVIPFGWKGRHRPVVSCDPESHKACRNMPQCVAYCPTGSLMWTTKDEYAAMVSEYHRLRETKPSYKARAPWSVR